MEELLKQLKAFDKKTQGNHNLTVPDLISLIEKSLEKSLEKNKKEKEDKK